MAGGTMKYNYEEIYGMLSQARKSVDAISSETHNTKNIVDNFPWSDPHSAENFKTKAKQAIDASNKVAEEFNELSQTARKLVEEMQQHNDRVARQWSS